MSVIFRPQKRTLTESMAQAKIFPDMRELFVYICVDWATFCDGSGQKKPFAMSDIILTAPSNDERIGWRDSMHVCVRQMGEEKYDIPQCIGFCETDFDDPE